MNELLNIGIWLEDTFRQYKFLKELYIIGSILSDGHIVENDVDIIQRISFSEDTAMGAYVQHLNTIKKEFYNNFSKPLHITTFTQNESVEFKRFISLNKNLKVI